MRRSPVEINSYSPTLTLLDAEIESTPPLKNVNFVGTFELDNPAITADVMNAMFPNMHTYQKRVTAFNVTYEYGGCSVYNRSNVSCRCSYDFYGMRVLAFRVACMLLRAGHYVRPHTFVTPNMVMHVEVPFALDLEALATHYPLAVKYDPSQFVSATIHMVNSSLTINLYKSGQCIVLGGHSFAESQHCFAWLYHRVLVFFAVESTASSMSSKAHVRIGEEESASVLREQCERLVCDYVDTRYGTTEPEPTVSHNTSKWTSMLYRMKMFGSSSPMCPFVKLQSLQQCRDAVDTIDSALAQTDCRAYVDEHFAHGCRHSVHGATARDVAAVWRDMLGHAIQELTNEEHRNDTDTNIQWIPTELVGQKVAQLLEFT